MINQEDQRNKRLDREIKILKEIRNFFFKCNVVLEFKKAEELNQLKLEEKTAHADISVGESALRNLKTKLSQ